MSVVKMRGTSKNKDALVLDVGNKDDTHTVPCKCI